MSAVRSLAARRPSNVRRRNPPRSARSPDWRGRRSRRPRNPPSAKVASTPTDRRQRLAALLSSPPPGPTRPGFWRSPLRGPWLTSVFGLILLVGITVLFVTGLLSYAAYNPDLAPGNDQTPDKGWLGFYLFSWPTSPYWLYRLTQGVHVTLGVVLIPILLAKLWSVIPKLFSWPPLRSPSQALERLSLLLLVGGALFEFVTGRAEHPAALHLPGSFYTLHFYGAWVFIGAFVVHIAFRIPVMVQGAAQPPLAYRAAYADRPHRVRTCRRHRAGDPESGAADHVAARCAGPGGGRLARTAHRDGGPEHRRVPPPDRAAGPARAGARHGTQRLPDQQDRRRRRHQRPRHRPDWRLVVRGDGREVIYTREQVLALPQHTAALPIACVEGWSTDDQLWSGVRLSELAALVGFGQSPPGVFVESAQRGGAFSSTHLRDNQVRDVRSLLALRVNGAVLSADHGYPARIIVPANPGVHNTKWVTRLTFGTAGEAS